MKKIIGIFKDYLSSHFSWSLYSGTIFLTTMLVFLNFRFDFEDSVIDSYYDSYWRVLWYFLIHFVPYLLIVALSSIVRKDYSALKNGGFWFFSILGFAVLGLDRGNPWQDDLTFMWTRDRMLVPFVFRLVNRLSPLLTILIPLALIYLIFLKGKIPGFYGIHNQNLLLRPYFWLLLGMVPLILLASFQPDFQKQYPNFSTARPEWFIEKLGLSTPWVAIGYELFYSVSFLMVELFFRGYLIFVLTRYLGEEVVLPMAVTYCVLHFGKPLGEAISSFFGGYILGILALKTRNIYGGIIIHIGIAWLMEIFAFLHI